MCARTRTNGSRDWTHTWRSTNSSNTLEQLHWLLVERHQVQDRLHHLQSCVHYPARLSPLITETLCSISYFTLFWLQFFIRPPCPHRFWVSQFFCSCSYYLEFPSLGYSKQFYHILFSPPTQNLLLQSSFSASLMSHPTPAQRRLRFGRSTADVVRFTNSFTYLHLLITFHYIPPIKLTFKTTPGV